MTTSDHPLFEGVQQVLELVRPMIQADGGDIELVSIEDDGVVVVKLLGACVGCPSAGMTLQTGIEDNLKSNVPGVTGVRALQ